MKWAEKVIARVSQHFGHSQYKSYKAIVSTSLNRWFGSLYVSHLLVNVSGTLSLYVVLYVAFNSLHVE